ncbi:F-box protein [Carex littledalei]|uniref:F-box protein n=1 Tax=Carex littledalei TaxID=544730 RepID=A0A833QI73_9POAL|nr:F-box protein [Carex littledalei]
MAREEENLSVTLEGSDQDEEMPTVSEALASATATASSSDDSGLEEEADELRIQALEQALRRQPLDYDSHLQVTTRLNDVMLFKAQQKSKGKIDHSSVSVKETTRSPLKRKTKQKSSAKAQPPAKKRKQNAPKIEEKPQPDHGRVEVDSEKQLEKEEESKEIEKPKPESYNDQCTAFVSSLNLQTKEEDLKSFFSDCGSVTAVQLVRDKVIGKSRVSSSKRHIDFPDHLLHKKILPCLPFKYLNRLKCISKELHSLISTDAKFAADQSRSADTSSSGFVYMSTDGILSFFPDPTLIGVPDPSLNFLNPTSFYDEINIVSCTNGLLLLDCEFSHKTSLCVCNPATKEMVFVPISVGWSKYFVYKMGLAYDPCELPDRFTIVHPHYNIDGYVYQFNVFCSDTGKWTRSRTSVCVGPYLPANKAVCAKGVIYWECREYLLWYDTKRDLAGSLLWPLMKPLIEEMFHLGVYAGEITCCLTWVGGIKVWRLTGGSCWDRLHATSWDSMLDALNFCEGMQLCRKSQSEMFFGRHIIFPVGFDGQFVYITVRLRKDKLNQSRFFRWETATGRVEERSRIAIWEPWYMNTIFKYANSMARVPQILKETS